MPLGLDEPELPPIEAIEPPIVGQMPKWARSQLYRARKKSQGESLTEEDLVMIWERSEGCCAISGLPFSNEVVGSGKARHPFRPSLDQIDAGKGYAPDNVRVVCAVANFAMNTFGSDSLLKLAHAISEKAKTEQADSGDREWYARQDARIREAEQVAKSLTGDLLRRQRARIAALKRARTLGPAGLKRAARNAIATKAAGGLREPIENSRVNR